MIGKEDLIAAVDILEGELPGASFSLSTIESDWHAMFPFGKGFAVTVSINGRTVFEKAATFRAAARAAVDRIIPF